MEEYLMINYDKVKEKISEFLCSLDKGEFEENYVEFTRGSCYFGLPIKLTFDVQRFEYKDGSPAYDIFIDDYRKTDYEAMLRTEDIEDIAAFIFEQLDIPKKSGTSTYTKILEKMEEERLKEEEEELKYLELKRRYFINIFEWEKSYQVCSSLVKTHIQNDLVRRIRDKVLLLNSSNSGILSYAEGQILLGPKFITDISIRYEDNTWYDIFIGSPFGDYISLRFITNIHEVIYIIYHYLDHGDKQVTEELLNRMTEREKQREAYMF